MMRHPFIIAMGAVLALTACGAPDTPERRAQIDRQRVNLPNAGAAGRETIFDLFRNTENADQRIEVNRFIWTAAQEILDFMPLETADPFSGVLVYGYGRPPGGGTAYRATVYVQDPALDARSLNLALATQSGPVDAATQRAIEDAILTRARQLRIQNAAL